MSRLRVRGAFSRGPFRGGLGDEAPPLPSSIDSPDAVKELYAHFDVGKQIDARTARILKLIEEQDHARKWTMIIGGASALFAAVKLGLVAFPVIKSRVGGS